MNVHELTLQNYSASSGCHSACQPTLYLGTAGSYGNEQINVVLGEGWQGLTVKAVFQPSGVPAVVPDGGGVISVPWEATQSVVAYPNGRISFQGYVSGRLVNTSDVPYTVGGSSAGTDNTPAPTPDEFQQFVDAVKLDADRAAQAAADAEAAVQKVTNAGTQAVTDIGNAKDSALEAIDAAREEAAGSISADVEGAKQAAADAEQSAADAEQSAKDAANALTNVQAAGKSALDDIATERQNTLSDIQNEGAKQQSAVAGAGTAALEAIGQTEQAAINQIKQTGETQVGAVRSAGTTQISQINSAGATQVQAVKDEGAAQTSALDDAAAAHKTELEAIASHPPQPNTETGKWQVWNAETGAYQDTDALYQGGYYTASVSDDGTLTWQGSQEGMPELPSVNIKGPKGDKGDPGLGVPSPTQSDAGKVPTVKADGSAYELAGPYAPLSAAIRPTASGNPVNITDSVEWPLLGLKVYGKSTQMTATGAQLFDAELFRGVEYAGVNVQILDDDTIVASGTTVFTGSLNILSAPFYISPGSYTISISQSINLYTSIVWYGSTLAIKDIVPGGVSASFKIEETAKIVIRFYKEVQAGEQINFSVKVMLNSGSTALPWEPYTGGQPSPSPDYPQEIVTAGSDGTIDITVSDGADQSQSLTISTPNGLPGIPVDSGGNYTDAGGQQWVCDEVDFERGVYVQRCATEKITGIPDFRETPDHPNRYAWHAILSRTFGKGTLKALSSFASWSSWGVSSTPDTIVFALSGSSVFYHETNTTAEAVNETFTTLIAAENCIVVGQFANPVETPLSPEKIAAYRALHTYNGITVVSTAEDVAGLEVKYVADAQKYIDDRLAAAESHIQEITAAQLNAQTGG